MLGFLEDADELQGAGGVTNAVPKRSSRRQCTYSDGSTAASRKRSVTPVVIALELQATTATDPTTSA